MHRRPFFTFLLIMLALACAPEEPVDSEETWNPGGVVKVPAELAAHVVAAKTVTLYRVVGEYSDDFAQNRKAPKVGGYPAFGSAAVPAAVADEIQAIITDGSNYLRENETWTCLPQPFYLLQFEGAKGGARVVIHECGDVEIIATGKNAVSSWQHGLRPSPNEKRLWELLRQVLPARSNCCGDGEGDGKGVMEKLRDTGRARPSVRAWPDHVFESLGVLLAHPLRRE